MQDAVALRTEGEQFFARIELEDPRTAVARMLASVLLAQFADHDDRRTAFTSLAVQQLEVRGQPQANISVQDPAIIATMRDIAKLADRVIVYSVREYEMLCKALQYRPRPSFQSPPHDAVMGPASHAERDTVVVWAPDAPEDSLAVIIFGLQELRIPVLVISAQSGDRSALRRARIIVDATTTHAGNALALAAMGVPLCCAVTSGVTEYLSGIAPYEPWDSTSVYRAVTTALGMGAPHKREVAWPAAGLRALREDGPLATIGIRTFNRPELLRRALQSIATQTYRNVEAIVVNDAGSDVSKVVAAFPFARLIDLEKNSGGSAGSNVAIEQAQGDYIGFLDDDDIIFPEHISMLVEALERAGAQVAHADTISAYLEVGANGESCASGYVVALDHMVEPTDFHVSDSIGPMSVLMRTNVARQVGGFDPQMPHAHDWEFYLKVSRQHDFVHVPYVTGMYSIRNDSSNMMQYRGKGIADSMRRMMELFPLEGRPLVDQARRDVLARFEAQGNRVSWPQPPLRLQ